MDLPPEWLEPIEAMAEATVALATCDPVANRADREVALVLA